MTSEPPPEEPAATPRASDWRVGVWRSFLRAHAGVVRELERELLADTSFSYIGGNFLRLMARNAR